MRSALDVIPTLSKAKKNSFSTGSVGASKAARSAFRPKPVRFAGPALICETSSRKLNSPPSDRCCPPLVRLFPPFLPHTRGFPCLSHRPSTTTCVLTPVFWVSSFFRSIRHFTNSMIKFHLGLKICYERLSLHRLSPSWEWPNAGNGHEPAWWSPNAEPERR